MLHSLMHPPYIYPIQVILCSAFFWLFFKLVIEPGNQLSFSRGFLLFSLVAPIILPLLSIPVYKSASVMMGAMYKLQMEEIIVQTSPTRLWNIPLFIYILITGVLCVRFFMQLLSLHKLTQSGTTEQAEYHRIVNSPIINAPFSFLHTIYLPKSLHSSEKELFILHESVHIHNRHSFDILFNEMIIILFWFNPIFWFTKQTIKNIHEYQADQAVLSFNQNIYLYKTLIVQEFLGSPPKISNTFHHSITKKRIMMLTKPLHTKFAALRIALAVPFMILNLVLFSCTSKTTQEPIDQTAEIIVVAYGNGNVTPAPIEENDAPEVRFETVAVKPQFQGGDDGAFRTWVNERLIYPETAKNNGIQGRVILSFIVDTDGTVRDVIVLRSVDPELDKEGVRVISMSPKWTPGQEKGKPVKVRYNFPIIFQLR